MLHIPPTNSLLLTAKQEPYKKAYLLTKTFKRTGQQAAKDKTERVTGLGRRTREEIAKWNQMTALRFRQGGDIRHPRPSFGGRTRRHSPNSILLVRVQFLNSYKKVTKPLSQDHLKNQAKIITGAVFLRKSIFDNFQNFVLSDQGKHAASISTHCFFYRVP